MKALCLAYLLVSIAIGAEYTIVPDSASSIRLEVDKTGILRGKTHVFTFPRFSGNVSYTEASVANSKVSLDIEAKSIQCQDTWTSANDRVKVQQYAERDMLAVDQYQTLRFRSTSVIAQGANGLEVAGTLTIRDVTRPAVVMVKLKPAVNKSMTAEGTAQIKLSNFKLKRPSAALGTVGTKDEMRLSFQLNLVRSSQ